MDPTKDGGGTDDQGVAPGWVPPPVAQPGDPSTPGPPTYPPAPGAGAPGGYGYGYGYGPGYGAPPGYGYGYGPPVEHPKGNTILVFGILGLVLCQLFGIAAWIQGNQVLREIDAAPGRYSNRSAVSAGRICGIVSTCLLVAILLLYLLGFVVFAGLASSSS